MNRSTSLAHVRSRRTGNVIRGAVQAAVTAAHHTRPVAGASAGEHAVWWARQSGALELIAEHEPDPGRAESARADAVTARRLAEGMAAAHAAQAGEPASVPQSTAVFDVVAELPDVSDLDVLGAGL